MFQSIITTFILVFLSELGDKTQLITMVLTSNSDKSKWIIFIGAALALISSSFIAVMLGSSINKLIPKYYINLTSGIFFILTGAWLLYNNN